jgi:sensor histidine kinase YesM
MIINNYQKHTPIALVKEYSLVTIFNIGIAILLWLLLPGEDSLLMFLIRAQLIGHSICTFCNILFHFFKPASTFIQTFLLIICILAGSLTGMYLCGLFFDSTLKNYFYTVLIVGLFFGIIISYFFIIQDKYSKLQIEKQEEELKSISLEKANIQSNLKLLQAQIEPHFLFNTLSTVLSLLDTDVETGKKMLENLTQYLRTSLKHTRNERNSLKQEMETIKSYLDINKIRMGDRLNYNIEIPQSLDNTPFPPMLIQPLVENAVKHGIEPKVDGGTISIEISGIVSGNDDVIKIEIADTGIGFDSNLPSGIGLENVKNRLKALYQDKSFIIFETNKPSGSIVTIGVPYEQDNSNNC